MKLTFKSTYKSIKQFPEISVSNFALITGANGTGKTHLLQAIAEGAIAADIAPAPKTGDAIYFDWNTMVPADQPAFDPHSQDKQRGSAFEIFEPIQRANQERVLTAAAQAGLDGDFLTDARTLGRLTDYEILEILVAQTKDQAHVPAIRAAIKQASTDIRNGLRQNITVMRLVEAIAKETAIPMIGLSREDFFNKNVPSWGEVDAFQQSFARLFSTYRKIWRDNELREYRRSKTGEDTGGLSDEEFIKKYNIPPWNFVNQTLVAGGLDFEVDAPPEYDDIPYKPRLTKRSTGVTIGFADLSSGEKILMALALCVYYAEDGRQIARYPKLLLLDEIDAPLHPAMSRHLVSTLSDVLVDQHGISVVMVTHSPSTVAMSPPGSTYLLEANSRLRPATKDECLNILTEGVPTLSIQYSGRRQVLVESESDAPILSRMYETLRPNLIPGRSLDFIGTGMKPAKGSEVNGGKAVVQKLVGQMREAGNKSVFGLIDWDGSNVPTDRVLVLSEGQRDGLENVMLDPLLVSALILRQDWRLAAQVGAPTDGSYRHFLDYGPSQLQPIVNKVQELVLGQDGDLQARMLCHYHGGFSLELCNDYLMMDDHSLEAKVRAAFPMLNKIVSANAGSLAYYVAMNVTNDQNRFIPKDFEVAFNAILSADPH